MRVGLKSNKMQIKIPTRVLKQTHFILKYSIFFLEISKARSNKRKRVMELSASRERKS